MNDPDSLALYRQMLLIRRTEEQLVKSHQRGLIHGACHTYIGQEAIAAGVCGALERRDFITTTHRGHGHCLAKGADAAAMMAELFGRATGTCHGRGGSMHIADPSLGILGANGVVGAGLPIAVGAGLAALRRGTDAVAVAFAGDGAVHGGPFYEAVSLAVLWNAPVLFVIENNRFSEFTDSSSMWRGAPLLERALALGVPRAEQVDGNDVAAVRAAAETTVAACRDGEGPGLIEALTYRVHGHYEGDPASYRDPAELDRWLLRDPIAVARQRLDAAGQSVEVDRAIAAAADEMDRAVQEGLAAPYPDPAAVLEHVYA